MTLDDSALDQLFRHARTKNAWTDEPVSDETLQSIYDVMKFGPTSANSSPARFVFLRTPESREKLRPALNPGNVEKTMAAPVTVIVAHDPMFYDHLPKLFPHADARGWFCSNPDLSDETAFRNGTLQGAYLMLTARAMGLDCGPMSGFDKARVDQLFLSDFNWKSNFLINLGHGTPGDPFERSPRLSFEDACKLI